jgi:transposase
MASHGHTHKFISKNLAVPLSTVTFIIKKHKESGSVENEPRTGRPPKIKDRAKRVILREVKKTRAISAESLRYSLPLEQQGDISNQTLRNVLIDEGLNGRIPRRKPFISDVNKKKRLDYAVSHINMGNDFWKKVLFTDESSFSLATGRRIKRVWRKPGEEYLPECVQPTFKSGNKTVMYWGCMSYNGLGPFEFISGMMNAQFYVEMLERLLPVAVETLDLPADYVFMQDNAPCHTARISREFFASKGLNVLPHPPQSPDLNPIEHIWMRIDEIMTKNPASSIPDLKAKLNIAWSELGLDVVQQYVNSMPRRLQAVIDAKGGITRY